MAVMNAANSVDLNYNGSTKFQTTDTGVEVTGDVITSGTVGSSTTGAMSFSAGTTAQRPGSASAGMVRFNSETSRFLKDITVLNGSILISQMIGVL